MNEQDKARAGELLNKWTDILGLGDWFIKMNLDCLPSEMKLESVSGEAEYERSTKQAVIRFLSPVFCEDMIAPYDFEKTLVHELLHLKFCLLENPESNSLRDRLLHQTIDDLAKAFVKAERWEMADNA